MASGLDLAKMNVSLEALIADNTRRLDYFLRDKGTSRSSHPVNPIRVQALNLFANAKSEEVLQHGMDELISILLKIGDTELDEHLARFIASAGIIVASADNEVKEDEFNQIFDTLASLKIFPQNFIEEIATGDIGETFNQAVGGILNINPGMHDSLLEYMIHITMSDKRIAEEEVQLLYGFGDSIGFTEMEVASAIAEAIQKNYIPSLDAIV